MMTVENSPIFVDTNILVYANLAKSPFHLTAKERLRLLSEQGADLWVSRQVLREYLAAMTRRDILTEAIPVSFLVADVRYFAGYFQVAEEDSQVTERLLELMEKVPTGGRQVHDANIVATMQVYGIRHLLTHNTVDFKRFSDIITVLPIDVNDQDSKT